MDTSILATIKAIERQSKHDDGIDQHLKTVGQSL